MISGVITVSSGLDIVRSPGCFGLSGDRLGYRTFIVNSPLGCHIPNLLVYCGYKSTDCFSQGCKIFAMVDGL